ncbi:hypothetical protein [Micromonospora endolithica]|uniref:WD40 repeat domain-containing protein n=1 Tax=Micromonospora endolithica TaxID=230091 RepID=A0A3A9ZGC4_9ACTN|nr:hypothetical protein [Micromonospora endolithica]RKN46377.1 hypothetical protein D7223_15835 [Micromonospora endolithica]TWJ24884.1 hypothetical protein JD76_05042 [Micromonospora endolithica]
MRDVEVRRLLALAAEDVRPSHPAATAWDRARRVRRNRRAAGAAALAVVLLTGGIATALRPDGPVPAPPPPATTPGVVNTPGAPVQEPPVDLPYGGDPLARLAAPATTTLSKSPVRRALSLYQPIDSETYSGLDIRVLGDDGAVRTLDVVTPAPTRDRYGNQAPALKPGQLSPDGRTAVFPQTGELIVVDLTRPAVRRFPLDGYLELAVWAGDRVLVGGDDRTWSVDPVSGRATRTVGSLWDAVVPDPTRPGTTYTETVGLREALTVRTRALADGSPQADQLIGTTVLPRPYRVNEFYGRGWQRGDRIARAAWTTNPEIDGAEGVVVLDARTGEVRYLLDLGRDGLSKNCCEVLGFDGEDVVLRLGAGVARWRPATGEVSGVLPEVVGNVALAG